LATRESSCPPGGNQGTFGEKEDFTDWDLHGGGREKRIVSVLEKRGAPHRNSKVVGSWQCFNGVSEILERRQQAPCGASQNKGGMNQSCKGEILLGGIGTLSPFKVIKGRRKMIVAG